MPCRVFNFNFYKKDITTPRTIWAFQEISHLSNKCPSTVYTKSALNLVGQFFLKMILGGCLNLEGRQKNFRGIYDGWCHESMVLLSLLFNLPAIYDYLIYKLCSHIMFFLGYWETCIVTRTLTEIEDLKNCRN